MVVARALYSDSASAEDLKTVVCFFDFHEIIASPKNTQYHVTNLFMSLRVAQSVYENPRTCVEEYPE